MKKTALGLAALGFAVSAPAMAADMAMKAPEMPVKAPVVAAPSWTGFYIGGNVGYGVGRDPTSATELSTNRGTTSTLESETVTMAPAGWLGGVQFGYNWQIGHTVLGVEADWQWSGQRDQACLFTCSPATDGDGPSSVNDEQRLDWFATARGRVGYAANHSLWYLTGGPAFARIESNHAALDGAGLLNPQIPTTGATSNASFNRAGFALAAGVETVLGGHWTAKLEYLYLDLGSVTDTINTV